MSQSWSYPPVRRDESFYEVLHGVKVADPYRWLEEPDSAETKAFVKGQNDISSQYICSYPHREKFRQKITKIVDHERYGCPAKRGDYYYYFHNSGLQAQSVLYQLASLDAKPNVFIDPNTLEADGTASLESHEFSESGKYFVYGISKSGSDWKTIHFKSVGENEKPIDDTLHWVKSTTLSFTHDDAGMFYTRYPKPKKTEDKGTETEENLNMMVYYHRLRTEQSEDILIWKDPENPEHFPYAYVTDDGQYLIFIVIRGCERANKLWIANLCDGGQKNLDNLKFIKLVDTFEAQYEYITNENTTFYFKTNLNASNYKIVKCDISKPDEGFSDVVPGHPVDVITSSAVVNQTILVLVHMHDVKEQIALYSLHTGKCIKQLDVPIGSISDLECSKKHHEVFFKLTNFLNPGIIYNYNCKNDSLSIYKQTTVSEFDTSDLETTQVFIKSKDGTKIPAFVIACKGISHDGNNPTLLYGYGGFHIKIKPSFSSGWLMFVRHFKGIVVIANIRGGSEYGHNWHKAGMLHNKQNCFDDFQAVAKWLADQKYTCPERLAINGASNGGLLVGACINQAPELFGAAIADVGVMDIVRFHKFTVGHAWKSDYGDPDKKEDFEYSYKYSPYHNVQSTKPYPSTLLTSSDHDDRVVPLHSYKYIAQLQHVARNNPNPLMIRIDVKAGHGAGKPTQKKIDEATDKYSFIAMALKADWTD